MFVNTALLTSILSEHICLTVWNCGRSQSTVAQLENINGGVPNGDLEDGPLRLYEHRLSNGELRSDENQRVVVDHLQKLSHEIENYMQQRDFHSSIIADLTSVCFMIVTDTYLIKITYLPTTQ